MLDRVGNVNYLVHMPDHKKKRRVLHVNMLQKWHQPMATVFLAKEAAEEMNQEEVPAWNEADEGQPKVGSQLNPEQTQDSRIYWLTLGVCFGLYQDTQQ